MKHQAEVQEVAGEAAKRHQRKLEELTNAFAQHDAQVAKSQRVQAGDNKARQESAAALRKQAQELVKARMEMLRTQSADLGKLLSMGRGALGSEQYDAVRNALRGVREEMRQIEGVMQRMDSYSTRSLFAVGRGTTQDYAPLISSTQKLVAAKEQATQASRQMTVAEQQLAQALNHTTQAAHGQSQVLSDLKSLATQYLGVWGGQQFLHNIIEIGGQLEMQRLSIGAILQNTAQANELFDKIKGLATQSPFGVVQLDQMTKQLTAYGFKYNELYDMTKRLADISAATGTDVSRLALALGHVRSEAALSGYTLRQFSMANVPLLQKLSEKLGKTTKEIRDMVKKKEVGYDDVIGVLKDLTNEGGMFYNMQEVISESVKAKFKNVRDAMDIMYGEMAEEAPGDVLKGVANVLMELTRHWKDVATVLGSVTLMWGIHKAAVMLNTKVMGEQNARTIASISAFRAKEAAMLKTATTYRTLTAAEKSQIATSKLLTTQERIRLALHIPLTENQKLRIQYARQQYVSDLKVAVAEKKLTTEYILRQVALGKLTKAEAAQILTGDAAALSALNNTKVLGAWRRATLSLTLGITKLAVALKSLLLNPAMLGMAAITAAMESWQRKSSELEKVEELSKSIYEQASEAIKNSKKIVQDVGIQFSVKGEKNDYLKEYRELVGLDEITFANANNLKIVVPEFDISSAKQSMEEWIEYIKTYAATPNAILKDAFENEDGSARKMEETYHRLAVAVGEVAAAQAALRDLNTVSSNAIDLTGDGFMWGIFEDNFLTDIKDYDKTLSKYSKTLTKYFTKFRQNIEKGVDAAIKGDAQFASATKGMENYIQKFDELVKNSDKYSDAVLKFVNADGENFDIFSNVLNPTTFFNPDTGWGDVLRQAQEMQAGFDDFIVNYKAGLERSGVDLSNISDIQKQAILNDFKAILQSVEGMSKETYEYLLGLFADEFDIKLDLNDYKFKKKLDPIIETLNALVDGEYPVTVTAIDKTTATIQRVREDYKKAKDFIESNRITIKSKFGFDPGNSKIDPKKIEQLSQKYKGISYFTDLLYAWNEAIDLMSGSTKTAQKGGFSLIDSTKGGKVLKPEKKTGKSGGSKEDKVLKDAQARLDLLKKVLAEYKKYTAGGRYSKEGAIDIIDDLFGSLNRKQVEDIIDHYIEKLDEVRKGVSATSDARKRFIADIDNTKASTRFDRDVEDMKRASDAMKEYIDRMKNQWEKYRKIVDSTGNKDIASQYAFYDGYLWDDVSREYLGRLQRGRAEAGLDNEAFSGNFNWMMDAEEAKAFFYKDGRLQEPLYELFLTIQKLIRSNWDKTLLDWAEAYKKNATYAERMAAVDAKIEEARKLAPSLPDFADPKRRELLKERDSISFEEFENTVGYLRFFSAVLSMTGKEAEIAGNIIKNRLTTEFTKGNINARDYAKRMKDVNTQLEKSRTTKRGNIMSFLSGGMQGFLKQAEDDFNSATIKVEQAVKERNEAIAKGDAAGIKAADLRLAAAMEELEAARKRLNIGQKTLSILSDISFYMQAAQGAVEGFQKIATGLSDMFEALGNKDSAAFWSDTADAFGAVGSIFTPLQNVVQNAMSGNVGGIVSSAISAPVEMFTGPIAAFARLHDKQLQREIEASQQRQKEMENLTKNLEKALSRTLGGVYYMNVAAEDLLKIREARGRITPRITLPKGIEIGNYLGRYGSIQKVQEVRDAYDKAMETGEYYDVQRALLFAKQDELRKQLKAEEDKKKSDAGAIEDYKQAIREMDDEIKNFALDMADTLYNIDIKSWASQLGDALFDAWQKGEDGAEAFKKKATELITDLAKSITATKLIEKALEPLSDIVVEEMDRTSGKLDELSIDHIAAEMAKVGTTLPDAYNAMMEGIDQGLQQAGLLSMKDLSSDSGSTSAGIKSITENTADLLASYLNAIRADVSVNRAMLSTFVQQLWPIYYDSFKSNVKSVSNIDRNVQNIMEMMSEGRGAMYREIHALRSRIDNVVNGSENVHIS